jgi:DegV family protein with EDD domain
MFKIISDAGCDFTEAEAKKYDLSVIPFYIIEENGIQKTAQPNPQDYADAVKPCLENGREILIFTISSKLSGSYNSAALAADMLKEEYPHAAITILDSKSGSIGQGLILREIIKMRSDGYGLQKAVDRAKEIIETTRVYFTVENLDHLRRGGRISSASALVGGVLGLRPILHLLDGRALPLKTIRGKKNAHQFIEKTITDALKSDLSRYNLAVGHVQNIKDAYSIFTSMESSLGIQINTPITEVGAAISTHTGPGTLAFAYCEKYDFSL